MFFFLPILVIIFLSYLFYLSHFPLMWSWLSWTSHISYCFHSSFSLCFFYLLLISFLGTAYVSTRTSHSIPLRIPIKSHVPVRQKIVRWRCNMAFSLVTQKLLPLLVVWLSVLLVSSFCYCFWSEYFFVGFTRFSHFPLGSIFSMPLIFRTVTDLALFLKIFLILLLRALITSFTIVKVPTMHFVALP